MSRLRARSTLRYVLTDSDLFPMQTSNTVYDIWIRLPKRIVWTGPILRIRNGLFSRGYQGAVQKLHFKGLAFDIPTLRAKSFLWIHGIYQGATSPVSHLEWIGNCRRVRLEVHIPDSLGPFPKYYQEGTHTGGKNQGMR